jgi:hypothetical protein
MSSGRSSAGGGASRPPGPRQRRASGEQSESVVPRDRRSSRRGPPSSSPAPGNPPVVWSAQPGKPDTRGVTAPARGVVELRPWYASEPADRAAGAARQGLGGTRRLDRSGTAGSRWAGLGPPQSLAWSGRAATGPPGSRPSLSAAASAAGVAGGRLICRCGLGPHPTWVRGSGVGDFAGRPGSSGSVKHDLLEPVVAVGRHGKPLFYQHER